MANTALAGDSILFWLKNKTQGWSDWKEAVCSTDLAWNDSFDEITGASKCGTQTLPGSRTISVEGAFFVLDNDAEGATVSERELSAGFSAKDTWYFKVADAYSGALYQDKEGEGKFTAMNITFNTGDFATANFTFQVVPETYVDNLAS